MPFYYSVNEFNHSQYLEYLVIVKQTRYIALKMKKIALNFKTIFEDTIVFQNVL